MTALHETNGNPERRVVARAVPRGVDFDATTEPAIDLLRAWSQANRVPQVLCRLQQRLERRVLGAVGLEAVDLKVAYATAYQAEVEAETAALKLQDRLPDIRARTLLGVVAKLGLIVGSDREIDDPTDFPWPHIASALQDLKAIAGDVPACRSNRASVRADAGIHWEAATKLVAAFEEEASGRLEQAVPAGAVRQA